MALLNLRICRVVARPAEGRRPVRPRPVRRDSGPGLQPGEPPVRLARRDGVLTQRSAHHEIIVATSTLKTIHKCMLFALRGLGFVSKTYDGICKFWGAFSRIKCFATSVQILQISVTAPAAVRCTRSARSRSTSEWATCRRGTRSAREESDRML